MKSKMQVTAFDLDGKPIVLLFVTNVLDVGFGQTEPGVTSVFTTEGRSLTSLGGGRFQDPISQQIYFVKDQQP